MTIPQDLKQLPGYKDAFEKALESLRAEDGLEGMGLEGPVTAESAFINPTLEAVIRADLRPAYHIARDRIIHDSANDLGIFVSSSSFEAQDQLIAIQDQLERGAHQVGHIRLFGAFAPYVATGWLVEGDIMVTNQHVARAFVGRGDFGVPVIPDALRVELNSLDQVETTRHDVSRDHKTTVVEPLYVAGPGEPDVALFRVENTFVEPLGIAEQDASAGQFIGVVGYPERDLRTNNVGLVNRFFGDQFDVKRFSPGQVMEYASNGVLTHDASTLGGNSGSALFSFEERPKIVGLHFAGAPNVRNSAVPASVLNALIRARREQRVFASAAIEGGADFETPTTASGRFDGREGFDPDFLGEGAEVDLGSILEPVKDDLADTASGDPELKYHHFSVFMNEGRRLATMTAVNIDGNRAAHRPGSFTWGFDGRMGAQLQAGDALYLHNSVDKGHLVRRLDPVWIPQGATGDTDALMREIIKDTYHYTVAGPQHRRLNRREWLELEDYILDASEKFGFRVSVLTGPVFRSSDPLLFSRPTADIRDQIKVPEEFWKVAIMRDLETSEMRVAGFMLSQGRFLHDINETEAAFVLGEGAVFRATLAQIETVTGLDFSAFHAAEVPPPAEVAESVLPDNSVYKIQGPRDVFF